MTDFFLIKVISDSLSDKYGEIHHQLYITADRDRNIIVLKQRGFCDVDEFENEEEFLMRAALEGVYPTYEIQMSVDENGKMNEIGIFEFKHG